MNASHRRTALHDHRAESIASALEAALGRLRHLPRKAGAVMRTLLARVVAFAGHSLSLRQLFAAVFVMAVLLYLFALLVEPTGAGRGGR